MLESGKVNYWTGKQCNKFEHEFAAYCSSDYAVALANGSVALELALYALGIESGDEVIVPCRSFIASASSVVMRGATPIFTDIDETSQNITASVIKQALSKKTKAIIVVHLAGWPCDMDEIMALADEHDLYVIEDCAQAHGAKYRGKPVGSFGHAAAFSFCQDKIMSTGGEGGMLVTNDQAVWQRAWEYKDHGKSYAAISENQSGGGFRWVHESIGTNWRMTEMQAAIGRCQLRKIEQWHTQRTDNATRLYSELAGTPGILVQWPAEGSEHAWYKFYCFILTDQLKESWSRDRVIDAINAEGIPCATGSCGEIYREKAFTTISAAPAERFSVASELSGSSMMFQVHPTMVAQEITDTILAVRKVMTAAVNDKMHSDI